MHKSNQNSTWLLTAKHYYELADEYLTLYLLHDAYNKGAVDEVQLLTEVQRLLFQREELMLLAESVKVKVNSYLYLRHMSIFRQLLLDLQHYLRIEITAGRKPMYNVYDWKNVLTKEFDFLR